MCPPINELSAALPWKVCAASPRRSCSQRDRGQMQGAHAARARRDHPASPSRVTMSATLVDGGSRRTAMRSGPLAISVMGEKSR